MVKLVRRSELTTATWAGGTTTQLSIRPIEATYKQFDFDFRVSYATVETATSVFTFMPGVTRNLMILKGSLEIDHTGRYKKQLKKFDLDQFDGEWPTTAAGKVTDFNLMTRNGYTGKLESFILNSSESQNLELNKPVYTGVYLLKGKIDIVLNSTKYELLEGDFIEFENEKDPCIITAANHSEGTLSQVFKV